MFKKVKYLASLMLAITVICTSLTPAFAESTKQSKKEKTISSSTIITESNLKDVLKYLGIDSSKFTATKNTNSSKIDTVGELETVINQYKNQDNKLHSTTQNHNIKFTNAIANSSSETAILYSDLNMSSYTLEYSTCGYFSGKSWTGVGYCDVNVSDPSIGTVHKIKSKVLSPSFTSSTITLTASVDVESWVGINDIGLIYLGDEPIDSTIYWYASQEL